MEPTENIQPRKRIVDFNTNWDIFFICQNDSKIPIQKLGSCGLEKVQNALREPKKCQDYARWDVVYHKDCYGTCRNFHKFHASEETTKSMTVKHLAQWMMLLPAHINNHLKGNAMSC